MQRPLVAAMVASSLVVTLGIQASLVTYKFGLDRVRSGLVVQPSLLVG